MKTRSALKTRNFIMEQKYLQSGDYMHDLEALIHLKTHESFVAKAESDVLKNLIEKTKAECDTIAAKIKTVEHSSDPEEKEVFKKLSEDIIEKWTRYKYYQDRKADIDQTMVKICNELGELLFQKMHMEEVHL